jgi:Transposase DDE domain
MQEKNLSKICDTVMNFFHKRANEVDKEVQFVKRESKLGASLFAQTLIVGSLSDPTISLQRCCQLMKEKGVRITKQGLHQRFHPQATLLMKHLFLASLKQFETQRNDVLHLLKPFTGVKMRDSSAIGLPSHLKNEFKGCGGDASEAGLKVQVMLDYMEGQVNAMSLTEGCRNDQGFDDHVERIEKGALYLQDLGYFKLTFFEKIRDKEAYFISRYSYPTTLLDDSDKLIDLLKELSQAQTFFSKKVRLGKKEKIAIRLVAFRLSEQEVEKRVRRLRKKAKKSGRIPAQETLELAKWSIYMTNVPESLFKDEHIHLVYTLRWQIELFFKLCKSEAGLDKVSGKTSDRILCEIYAKLICVVMLLYFCFPLRWQVHQELSYRKAYKSFQLKAFDFFQSLQSPYRLIKFIKAFFSDLIDFAMKDKHRKKKRLSYQKIMDATAQETLACLSTSLA